jgi:protein-tyrosine phosphatase
MVKVLFVCTGNICRSPTAHGVFRALVDRASLSGRIGVDSAGTHAYHVGEPPDRRSTEVAQQRGFEMKDLRARQVVMSDFRDFDLLLAMDRGHMQILRDNCPPDAEGRLAMFLSFAPQLNLLDVPDPYYGGHDGFEKVLNMIEAGAAGLLAHIRETML